MIENKIKFDDFLKISVFVSNPWLKKGFFNVRLSVSMLHRWKVNYFIEFYQIHNKHINKAIIRVEVDALRLQQRPAGRVRPKAEHGPKSVGRVWYPLCLILILIYFKIIKLAYITITSYRSGENVPGTVYL